MGQLKFDITGDNSAVLRTFKGVQDGVRQTAQVVEQQGQSIENVFNRIKSVASVAFAGFTAKEIVSTLATIRGDFQQSEIAFETMLGSAQKAKTMIADLANLAATTPFDMKGVVSGAKSLLAYGFAADEITDTMRRLGDVCAGLGLNLQDMAWLYGTTMVQGRLFTQDFRQFTGRGIPLAEELAKQFGVTKDKVQELVTAGKVGFPEVKKAMESMTNEGGKFGGLMEKQSHSITGQIANIQDTIEMAINDLGTQTEGIMNDALDITSTVIDHWKEIGEAILAAASAIGLYKAMAVSVAAFDAATTNVGYATELSALDALLPAKEQAKKTDLEEAVAKGQLSAAQAELVASKREEVAAYVQELQAKAAAMKEEAAAAAQRVAVIGNELANNGAEVERLQDAVDALETYTDAEVRETLETQLNTAANEQNNIAKHLKTARAEAAAAALAAETAQTEANAVAQNADAAATARGTAAKGIHAQITLLCEKAQRAWNNSMFASPLFWIAATIAAVTYAVYKLATAESAHEEAVRKSNEAWDEFDDKVNERQRNIENLIRTIQSETATEYDKAEAYQKLSYLAPQLTEEYSQAQLASADFAKTQKEVAESMNNLKYDQAVAEVEKYRKKVEELSMTTQSVAGHTMGGTSNGRAYEQAKEDLEQAEEKLANIIQLREQAEENAKPIEIRLEEAKENEAVRKEIFDFYDKAIALADDWQSANETINFATGESRLDEFIAKTEKEIEDLRKDIEKKPADFKLRMEEEEKTKVLNHLLAMKDNWKATGATTIPLIFKADWQSAQQSLTQAKNKAQALANSGSTESYAQAYTKAQKEYNAAMKKVAAMEKNKSKYTATEYQTATEDLKAAKDAYSKLGGDVSGKSTKAAENARKNRSKKEKEEVKLQEELNQKLKSLQQKNIDTEISIMEEGTKKKIAEIKNDYKKRLDEITKQEAEFKKKNKEAGKKGTLTKEQQSAITEANRLNSADYSKRMREVAEEDKKAAEEKKKAATEALQSYLVKYGSYEQKRLAITQQYEQKIKEAKSVGESMSLNSEMQKELNDLAMKEFDEKFDWETVFNNLDTVSVAHLQKLKESLKKMLDSKDLLPDQAKVITERIDAITKQITKKKNAWKDAFGISIPELERINQLEQEEVDAKEKLVKAQEQYNEALAKNKELQSGIAQYLGQFGIKVDSSEVTSQNSQNLISQMQNLGQTTQDLSSMFSKLGQSEQGLVQAGQGVQGAQAGATAASGAAGGAAGAATTLAIIEKIITTINKNVQSMADLLEEMNLSDSTFAKGWSSFAQSSQYATNGFQSLKEGDVVGVASNVMGSLRTLGDALGKWGVPGFGSSDNDLEDAIERLTQSNANLQTSIDTLADKMDSANSMSDIGSAYEDQKKYLEQAMANTKELMRREGDVSSKGFLGIGSQASSNAKINEAMSASEWSRISKIVGTSVNSAQDFWNLTSEQMSDVAAYAGDLYDKIKQYADDGKGNAAQYMDTYIAYYKELEELEEKRNEKFTNISFDSLVSDFQNALEDMDTSTEDFADDFEEMMRSAIVNSMITETYKKRLKDWYANFSSSLSDGDMSKDERDSLYSEYQSIIQDAVKERDALFSTLKIDSSSGSQSATSGGWESMGQDSADELNGRFAALQVSGESIARNMESAIAQMEAIVTLGISTNGAVLEIRNMMIMTNSYLEDVVKYAKLTYNDFGSKLDDMNARLKNI